MRAGLAFLLGWAVATAARAETVQLPGMGTVWKLEWEAQGKTIDSAALRERFLREIARFDEIFSDWNETSELRKLERRGLTAWQRPSPQFLSGLRLSQEAFERTQGLFDPTTGAVTWKVLPRAVGFEQIQFRKNSFRFRMDPKRLSFGGIAKGAAVGALARLALDAGMTSFRFGAGGSSLASTDESHPGRLRFRASSRVKDFGTLAAHIQHPRLENFQPKHAGVHLECAAEASDDLTRISALTDALTKGLLLADDPRTVQLPPNCTYEFQK